MFEFYFVAATAHLICTSQVMTLMSSEYRTKYGALYADLRPSKLSMLTTVLSNVRCVALILLLVLLHGHAGAQSWIYLTFAIFALGWDVWVRPYSGGLIMAQALVMDLAKLAAGAGYVALTLSEEKAEGINRFEVATLLSGVGAGLALAAADIMARLWAKLRRTTEASAEGQEKARVTTTNMPLDISTATQNTAMGSPTRLQKL